MEYRLPIDPDRLGVLIGRKGEVKRRIETLTNTSIEVNEKEGVIKIRGDDMDDVLTASNIVKAINLGFSPEKAFILLDRDMNLHIVDIYTYLKKRDENNLRRVLGRIIGEKGKTKRIIEETTETYLSIYRNYVAIIGSFDGIFLADEAIKMLALGKPHKVVYEYLYNARRMGRGGFRVI